MTDPFLKMLEEKRMRRDAERMRLNKRLGELNREGEEDALAARVYQQTMAGSALAEAKAEGPMPDGVEATPPRYVILKNMPMPPEKLKVKDMVLTLLRDAFPGGLSASQIRGKAFLKWKEKLNPNTLTVTLVRYSKTNQVKIEDRVWYYVPANEGPNIRPAAANGGEFHSQLLLSDHHGGERA